MKDMLRTLAKLDPALVAQADFAMIETSARLAEIQKATLEGTSARIDWHETVETLADAPLIIVGNELFDAFPIRQYVKIGAAGANERSGWTTRQANFRRGGRRARSGAAAARRRRRAGRRDRGVRSGTSALMETIAARIARNGGAGLFIDYGYAEPAIGDTLQA